MTDQPVKCLSLTQEEYAALRQLIKHPPKQASFTVTTSDPSMSSTETPIEKEGIGYKPTIKTTAFLAWFVLTIFFIVSMEWKDVVFVAGDSVVFPFVWANPFIKLLAYMIVTGLLMVLGMEKGTNAVLKGILGVVYDPTFNSGAKLAFITQSIEKLIGVGIVLKESEQIKKNAATIAKSAENVAKQQLANIDKTANTEIITNAPPVPAPPALPPK